MSPTANDPLSKAAFAIFALMPLLIVTTRAGADIAICIADALFLLHCVIKKDFSWLKPADAKALAALWLFMMAGSLASPISPSDAFLFAFIWGRFPLFYIASRAWVLQRFTDLPKLTYAAIPVLFLAAIDTFWQYKTGLSLTGHELIGFDRLTGPLTKANIGNYFIKVAIPFAGASAYLMIRDRRFTSLWIPVLLALSSIAIVMISGERSTALLMLLSFGVLSLMLGLTQRRALKWVTLGIVCVAGFFVAIVATQPIFSDKAMYFLEQINNFWNTPYGQLYTAAWRLWQQHPITGIGPHQFLAACNPDALKVIYCDLHPHNAYVEWLVATGLPGIALFILSMALVLIRRLRDATFSGTEGMLTAFAICGFCVVTFPFVVTQSIFSNWSAALFWYTLSLAMCLPDFAKARRSA